MLVTVGETGVRRDYVPHSFMEIARTPGVEMVRTGLGVVTYDGIV